MLRRSQTESGSIFDDTVTVNRLQILIPPLAAGAKLGRSTTADDELADRMTSASLGLRHRKTEAQGEKRLMTSSLCAWLSKKVPTFGTSSKDPVDFVATGSALRCPLWLRDWRTWAFVVATLAVIGVGVYLLVLWERRKHGRLREDVLRMGRWHAAALVGQLQATFSSVRMLSTLLRVDDAGFVSASFQMLSDDLIRNLKGISSLQLAPNGTVQQVHPPMSPDHGLSTLSGVGHSLLLDQEHALSLEAAISSASISVVGPLRLPEGGHAMMARLPVFSEFAPRHLPVGQTHSQNCTALGCANFEGLPDASGEPTFLWGFVVVLSEVAELLKPLQLDSLEAGGHACLSGSFQYQLWDVNPETLESRQGGVLAQSVSSSAAPLDDAIDVPVLVEELGVHWVLSIAPIDGWPVLSREFWMQAILLALACSITGAAIAFGVLSNVRLAFRRLKRLELFRMRKKFQVVGDAVRDMDRVRFPMCIMAVRNLEGCGRLVSHEVARERTLLKCLDTAEDMEAHKMETAFASHQWSSFGHPDACNTQYQTIVHAMRALKAKGLPLKYVWVDYYSIPQKNPDTQQNAIDSLAVYAINCSVFVAIVPDCIHGDLGTPVDETSYSKRAWCRLEQLAFLSATAHSADLASCAYRCDGVGRLKPLWREDSDWQMSLEVMNGEFSCCARGHPGMMPCDKNKIVGVVLGTVWRLKDGSAQHADDQDLLAHKLLDAIDSDPDRFFPHDMEYLSQCDDGEVTEKRELFGDTIKVLHQLFKARDGGVCEFESVMSQGSESTDPDFEMGKTLSTVSMYRSQGTLMNRISSHRSAISCLPLVLETETRAETRADPHVPATKICEGMITSL